MATQVNAPLQQVALSPAGWTHNHLFYIRNIILGQMNIGQPVLSVTLDITMPRGDQATSELAAAMGDIFTVMIDPVACTITFVPDVGGIEAKQKGPPRSKNCFVIYRLDKHPFVAALNPTFNNNDLSKIIGELWRNEPPSVKDAYKMRALEEKRLHAIAYPNYVYKPRKPSEKKKRMTKNKLAKLAASRRTTQTSGWITRPQQELPAAAPPTPTDPIMDVLLTLSTDGETIQMPNYGAPRANKYQQTPVHDHLQSPVGPPEQSRQDELNSTSNMEEFFAFDAADGPIPDSSNGAWEAFWDAE